MQSDKWGPHAWEYLHTVTFNYPERPSAVDKQNHYDLFNNLRSTLPCGYCRQSYGIFFEHVSIDDYLDSRFGLVFWLYVVHNIVNLKLNKDVVKFSDVVRKYEGLRAQCGKMDDKEKLQQCRANLPPVDEQKVTDFCQRCVEKYEGVTLKNILRMVENGVLEKNFKGTLLWK
jgi:hypothetical protein